MIRIYEIDASLVLTPPAGRARIFLDSNDNVIKARLDDGSLILLSVNEEYVEDVVGGLFGDSSTIDFTYNDAGNVATIDVKQEALDISLIPNVPSGNLTSTNVQAALNELQTDIDDLNTDLAQEIVDRQNADTNLQTQIDNITSSSTENAQDAVAAAFSAGIQDGVTIVYDDVNNKFDITNVDKGTVAVTAHEAAIDPHPQYETAVEVQTKVDAHATLTNNPHNVTKTQVGLGNVQNVDTTIASNIVNVPSGNISSINVQAALNELDSEKQPLDSDLTALSNLITTGLIVRTGTGTAVTRTIEGTVGNIDVSNGSGVSGNPVINLPNVGTPNTYGSATEVPVITTDAQGRVTSVISTTIDIDSTNINDFVEASQDAVGTILTDTASIDFTYNDISNSISADVLPSGVDHNLLNNYVSNEHVDHSTVSINAGVGLVGGGDITSSRTLDVVYDTPVTQIPDQPNSDGVANFAARADHVHNIPTGTPSTVGTANAEGTASSFARQDHIHDHGNQTTPTHHAVATTVDNGFMSSSDKSKLDGISGTRIFKAGNVAAGSFVGIPRTASVVFSTPMPDINYAISITGFNSRTWRYESKTVNGFVINTGAAGALTGEVSWIAINNGESVE